MQHDHVVITYVKRENRRSRWSTRYAIVIAVLRLSKRLSFSHYRPIIIKVSFGSELCAALWPWPLTPCSRFCIERRVKSELVGLHESWTLPFVCDLCLIVQIKISTVRLQQGGVTCLQRSICRGGGAERV